MKTKQELKLYFENGDIPTQNHFWEWQDSYWHKEEKISQNSVDSIEKIIPFMINDELLGSSISLNIPTNTKKIRSGAYPFTGMSYQITEVTFNEGLEEIGLGAFNSQNIKNIITPSTLKTIESSAFSNQANTINGTDSLESIKLNDGLETIGSYAFSCPRATIIKQLFIPSSVISVGQGAFTIPSLQTVSAPIGLDLNNAGIPETAIITYR
ncbi:leucine-rich repeat domain-containing protein [Chryseobacterium sp. SIMBA_038]|uniref:leucine-rich repeat domain-containing protein n=1 Tax=Chryseobacterium sp. SIMBA_038 TaxID=3085780 RepID=UPI0039796205